jgi:hypothetical protein
LIDGIVPPTRCRSMCGKIDKQLKILTANLKKYLPPI